MDFVAVGCHFSMMKLFGITSGVKLRFASVKIYHTQFLYFKFVFKSKNRVFLNLFFLEFLVKFQEKVYFCDKFLFKTSISNFEKQFSS